MSAKAVVYVLGVASLALIVGCAAKPDSQRQAGWDSSAGFQLPEGVKALDLESIAAALPKRWLMSEPEVVASRYEDEGREGVRIRFTGPRYVKRPKRAKIEQGNESLTLWIWPADHSAELPVGAPMPQREAEHLGSNGDYRVFWMRHTASVPTWPTWQEDLAAVLKIKKDE